MLLGQNMGVGAAKEKTCPARRLPGTPTPVSLRAVRPWGTRMTSGWRNIWATAFLLLAAPALAAGLPVTKKTASEQNRIFDISVAYPQTGVKTIDAVLAAYASGAVADFKALGSDRQPQDPA